ncbi:MAG TPA: phage protease [Conexibacter sp.]|nr:phage protease [Conexibacter sp.]
MTVTEATLAFFADAPDFTGYSFPDGAPEDISVAEYTPPTSRIQIAKAGKFKHPLYGKFDVTPDTFQSFIDNAAAGIPTSELPVDFDHAPEYKGDTKACGWIKKLEADGDKLYATVEWTWQGAYSIREREYRYISPTWKLNYTSDDGTKRGAVLFGVALTNRPFFEQMAVVALTQSFSRGAFATEDTETITPDPAEPDPSDSPAAMELSQIIQVFGLAADTTEEQAVTFMRDTAALRQVSEVFGLTDATPDEILAAARDAKDKADKAPADDQVVVTATKLSELETKANAGEKASQDLGVIQSERADEKFNAAFDGALEKGCVDAIPETRERFRKIFDNDHELALETLSSLQPIVNTDPSGGAGGAGSGNATREETNTYAIEGADAEIDQEGLELDRKAQAYAAEHKIDYIEAYHIVARGTAV